MQGRYRIRGAVPNRWPQVLALPVMLLIFLLGGEPAAGLGVPEMVIDHLPGALFISQRPLLLDARINDVTGILAARCYFRYQPMAEYLYVDLEQTGDGQYRAKLPAPALAVQEVEYFFLAVNTVRQVVRSRSYFLQQNPDSPTIVQETGSREIILRSEGAVPKTTADFLLSPGMVRIKPVEARERYGLVVGIYSPSAFLGHPAEGYFGGFRLDEKGKLLPVLGLTEFSSSVSESSATTAATESATTTDVVGPDIAGDQWWGVNYLDDDGAHYWPRPLTAVITQNGSEVIIDTSLSTRPIHLVGTMDADGRMLLYDEQEEDWTTFYGPATSTSITIADYSEPPSEENPSPSLWVVELQRDPPPPTWFLPAVYHLLLPRPIQ